jgi:glutamine---fructose-6-phosphate transaminase (isomerizing)
MPFVKIFYESIESIETIKNCKSAPATKNIEHRPHGRPSVDVPALPRTDSTSEFMPLEDKTVEYFFASDASAVIEHTNRVIYLEDDDVAAVKG